jgi:hypothetical protein
LQIGGHVLAAWLNCRQPPLEQFSDKGGNINGRQSRSMERAAMVERNEVVWMETMAIPVVEFSREGYKIRKVFG